MLIKCESWYHGTTSREGRKEEGRRRKKEGRKRKNNLSLLVLSEFIRRKQNENPLKNIKLKDTNKLQSNILAMLFVY